MYIHWCVELGLGHLVDWAMSEAGAGRAGVSIEGCQLFILWATCLMMGGSVSLTG